MINLPLVDICTIPGRRTPLYIPPASNRHRRHIKCHGFILYGPDPLIH